GPEGVEHADAGVDALVRLRVVPGRNAEAERERAGVGVGLAGHDAQQAGLAAAVETEDEQPLAPPEVEGDVVEHGAGAIPLAQPLDIENELPGVRRLRDADSVATTLRRRTHRIGLQALDPLVEALGDAGPL